MSQSVGNYIGITDPPDEMFGKLARVPDELIGDYRLLTLDFFRDPPEAERVEKGLADGSLDPWAEKRRLAREVVELYHGEGAGGRAEIEFGKVHRAHEIPEGVIDVLVPSSLVSSGEISIPGLLVAMRLADSRSEARRMMKQGGVRRDGAQVDVENLVWGDELIGSVWSIGRRKFARLAGLTTSEDEV
jgi:tyrosyl-tRNA synthetase